MANRKAISKRTRFAVFARDNFTCRYCGLQSDTVPLVVDHLVPVVAGGTNDMENLITACEACNQGKAGKTIDQHVPTEEDRLARAQERNEQMKAAEAAKAIAQARREFEQTIIDYWCDARGTEEYEVRTLRVITSYARQHGSAIVFQWIDQAVERVPAYKSDSQVGMYISGIRRSMIAEGSLPETE